MFKFQSQQHELHIAQLSFGGQPGKRRTVMVGSLFYPRHSLVLDRRTGKVDQNRLNGVLDDWRTARTETGCPAALMIYAETPEAMAAHLEQVADLNGVPFFLDSPSHEVRMAGVRRAKELGLLPHVIYNTASAGTTKEEWAEIAASGLPNVVLLAFNPADLSTKGKIYLLEDGGGLLPNGLIETAREAGLKNILLDMAVTAAEQSAGAALRGMFIAKAKWGLPCGCALHNAVESYAPLLEAKKSDPKLFRYVDVASAVIPIMAGADFVMFGPLEYSRRSMHAAAFADELLAQSTADLVYEKEVKVKH